MIRLFILSALMTKPDGSTNHHLGYRVCNDGEDAMLGRYVRLLMEDFPGWSLTGKINVMEIDRSELVDSGMFDA